MPKTKTRTLSRLVVSMSFKSVTDTNGVHTFEGLAATWAKDLGNDVIARGAFKKSIAEWKASGDALPLLNSHDHYDIFSSIGQLMDAKETKDGLWTKWALLPGPEGDAVHARLSPHPLTGKPTVGKMSIGYEPVSWKYEQPDGTSSFFDQIRHLDEVNLKEVSLVLFPMNPGASVDETTVKQFMLAIKSADPASLTALTRLQLRQLSSRIGTLLKTQPAEGAVSSPAPQASAAAPVPTGALADEDPEGPDEEDEEDDVEYEDEEETTIETADPPIETPAPPEPEKAEKATDPPLIYEFAEALEQRIKRLNLRSNLAAMKQHSA